MPSYLQLIWAAELQLVSEYLASQNSGGGQKSYLLCIKHNLLSKLICNRKTQLYRCCMYLNFQSRSAFSLVESAIILGILGLVIGGIWVAAAQVREQNRVTAIANSILFAAQSRGLFPRENYPTITNTGINATQAAAQAGLFPGAQLIGGNQEALLPVGVSLRAGLSCYTNCPVFNVTMNGPSVPSKLSRVSGAECKQIIRRFAGMAKNGTDMIYVQISSGGNSNYQFLYPPIDGATVDCPDNFDYVVFWFRAA